ncbi:MAG: murein biosynthesis integral membrane protein MurJ [Patescibacteria group bacterium]
MLTKLSKFWHGETNGIAAAAFVIGAASLASRLVGVLRDRALASTFGAGHTLDAYYAAFRVPDFLYNLIILGALSAGFIPIFSEYLSRRAAREAWILAEQTLAVIGAILVASCALLALLAPLIVPLTVPGFSGDQLDLTVRLSRIMLLSPLFLGLSAVMGGILQATRRFVAFALAPVVYNLAIIFGVYVFAPQMGITGVAWGVVFGAALHCAVQTRVAFRLGLTRIPWPSFTHEGVRRILKLMLPRAAGLAVSQVNLVILLAFASALPAGSVAVLTLATNLQSFPVGLIGVSFAIAAFPLFTAAASRNDRSEFHRTFDSAARKIMFFILPATALFILLRAQIVRLALGAGVFDWNDTIRTATVLGIFIVSLLGQSIVPLLARAFYAYQNTMTPLWIGIVSDVVNVGLAFALRGSYGIVGLAIAFSVATYVNAILLFFAFERRYGRFEKRPFLVSFVKSAAAATAIVLVGYPVRQWIGTLFPLRTFWQVAVQAGAAGTVGLAAFVFVAWLVKSPELRELHISINRRLFRHGLAVSGAEEAQGV